MYACKFDGARPIGKPKNWDEALDGPCGTIYVTDAIDTLTGHNVMFSVYKLTDEEIEALRNGGLLRLGIVGRAHPVFQLGVLSIPVEVEPVFDMGGLIDGNGI